MPTTTSIAVRLLTRVPYQFRHRAKVHCGAHDRMLAQLVILTVRGRLETTPHADECPQRAAAR